jgi:hypothetical protein
LGSSEKGNFNHWTGYVQLQYIVGQLAQLLLALATTAIYKLAGWDCQQEITEKRTIKIVIMLVQT